MNKNNLYHYLSAIILLIISLLGGLSLRETFSGDQAMFLVYSQEIDNGAVLYRDIWDLKQPAIFIFYLLSGKLFGFEEFGVHLFELVYWLILGLILIVTLKKYFDNHFFALLTPLFTIGIYYSVSGSWHLTQTESLVCFPLFMSLWCCQKFLENPNRKSFLFLSGVFGGIVLLFKQMLIGIPFFFWLLVLLYGYFVVFQRNRGKTLRANGLIILGILTPLAPIIFYFAQNDALGILGYTTFAYPYQAAISITEGDRTQILKNGLIWFAKSYFPVILLTFVLLFFRIKRWKEFNFLFIGLWLWIFCGFFVILSQRLSWWEYHYSLLMLPLGILAAKSLDTIFGQLKKYPNRFWKIAAAGIILLSFIPTIRRLNHKINQYFQVETVKLRQEELKITGSNQENYHLVSNETSFLRNESPPSKIFVMGDPLYYYLSKSPPAISTNGWMPTLFTKIEWQKLNREINEKLPKYIFLDKRLIQLIDKESPEFIKTIEGKYSLHSSNEKVLFYRINE